MSYRKKNSFKELIAFAIILAVILSLSTVKHFNRNTYTVIVTDKQVKRSNSDDKYLIFTELTEGKGKVFENTDSFLEGKFNSSDVYSSLKPGTMYEIKTYGWRIPVFSKYENIVEVKQID